MGQPKAPEVNWLDEAWRISRVIADMPTEPPGQFKGKGTGLLSAKWVEQPVESRRLDAAKQRAIEHLQATVAAQLDYWLRTRHKVRPSHRIDYRGKPLPLSFALCDHDQAFWLSIELRFEGVSFNHADVFALDAHSKLGRILTECWVPNDWKRLLPLIVASISGQSTSEMGRVKGKRSRRRTDLNAPLREARERRLMIEPEETWRESLYQLIGDELVIDWNATNIRWLDANGDVQITKTTTFQKWTHSKRTRISG